MDAMIESTTAKQAGSPAASAAPAAADADQVAEIAARTAETGVDAAAAAEDSRVERSDAGRRRQRSKFTIRARDSLQCARGRFLGRHAS